MGFMILQCGLGAFSAAMLHILAHSLYKAHAFLSSGSVISERSATSGADSEVDQVSWTRLAMGGAVVAGLLGIAFATTGIDVRSKPGGLLLGGIFCLALTHWIGQVMRTGNRQLLIRSLTVAGAMCFVYAVSFQLVDKTIASGLPSGDVLGPGPVAVGLVWFGFLGMFAIQIPLAKGAQLAWMKSFYVHALNGFYIENSMRRIFGPLSSV